MGDSAGISSSILLTSLGYSITGGNNCDKTGFSRGEFEFLEFEDTGYFCILEILILL